MPASSRARAAPRDRRARARASCARSASRSGLAAAAAAVGVAARRSATKSAIVKSVSWPTPLTTGMAEAAIARATASSLKAHRSSRLPPPRATMSTSHSRRALAAAIAPRHLRGRPVALHRRGIEDHRHHGRAARERGEDVAQRRGRRRGDHADGARVGGQRLLARGLEEALGAQPGLELLEGLEERAQPRVPHLLDGELVGPARLVDRDPGAHLHLQAVLGPEVEVLRAALEHGAVDGRALVLQDEVPVAGGGEGGPGDLPHHPDQPELVLQELPGAAVDFGDGEGRRGGQGGHGGAS